MFRVDRSLALLLLSIHVVFGKVVSGQEVVRQIESLPVDRNSRPLEEPTVRACGELIKQVKGSKDAFNNSNSFFNYSISSQKGKEEEEVSCEERQRRVQRLVEKEEEGKVEEEVEEVFEGKEVSWPNSSTRRTSFLIAIPYRPESAEEGELESDNEMLNPMVTITKIDPSEIPEVSNKFLMRGDREREHKEADKNGDGQKTEKHFGWSKRTVPQSKSGRMIKGRGNFRYRTPSRSRSRSVTPEHWKAAQRNVIKLTDFERLEDEKKAREAEMSRRADERKKRHDALSKGDGKKSFFELTQDVPAPVLTVASSLTKPEKFSSVDLNALDYEESDSEKEIREPIKNFRKVDEKSDRNGSATKTRRDRCRSRSRGSVKRSRSHERPNRDRRDFRPANRGGRFNDNRRWDNNRRNNRFDDNRWRRSRDRRSRSRSMSKSRSR